MNFFKRTWAEIDLDALDYNYSAIRKRVPQSSGIMAVVKADAYGHCDRFIACELEKLGVNWFGVSNLEEALSLRKCGISGNILILGVTPPENAAELAENNITQTVYSPEYAASLSAAAVSQNVSVRSHIKLDTGMRRIGFIIDEEKNPVFDIIDACTLPGLHMEGIFSHFSSADDLTPEGIAFTRLQKERFDAVISDLRHNGLNLPVRHLQNSAAIINTDCSYELARAGLILYGLSPEALPGRELPLKGVMSIRSVISMVKTIEPGDPVSYSRTYTASRPMKTATVPIGYADGYLRSFSNRAEMLVRGKRVPVIGNVCMDQLMLDVSEIPDVTEGDIVTAVGRDGDEEITFDELAELAGTISYELICLVGKRVPRICCRGKKMLGVYDLLQQK